MSRNNPYGLTDQQLLFADSYLADRDLNATQAYITAYPKSKVKSAEASASKLLRNHKVADYIAEQMLGRSDRTQVDSDWMLGRLADEVKADLLDLYKPDGSLRPVADWPLIWRQGLVSKVRTQVIVGDDSDAPAVMVTEVNLSDRVKRLELIGRHVDVQAFKDKVEVTDDTVAQRLAQRRVERQQDA